MEGLPLPPGEQSSSARPPMVIKLGDETLTEVDVSELPPVGDEDDASVFTEADDDNEEHMGEEDGDMALDEEGTPSSVVDMAHAVFSEHSDYVCSASLNSKRPGMAVTGGGDDRAFLWTYETNAAASTDPLTGNVLSSKELTGHTDTVTCVGFNFDGTLVMTGSYDGSIRVWDVASGELTVVLEGPQDIEWASWHTKGNAIVAGSTDGTIWMWMTHNGQCVQVFAGHDGLVAVGCFSSDGKVVCSGGDDGTVRVWAPKTGACKHVFEGMSGHSAAVTCIASDDQDPELLASGSMDGTVKLFHLSGKRLLQTFVHCRPEEVVGGASSAMETVQEEEEDGEGGLIQKEESILSVECVGFARGSLRWVASGGMDKTIKIWDTTNGSCRSVCHHNGGVVSLRWHPSLPVVCSGCLDNLVRIWDSRNGGLLADLSGHKDQVTNIDMVSSSSAEGATLDSIICTSDDGTARIFQIDTVSLLR